MAQRTGLKVFWWRHKKEELSLTVAERAFTHL
jgi:hypothetical protein